MSSALIITLIALCIAAYTFQSFFSKLYAVSYTGDSHAATPVFSILYGIIVGLITLSAAAGFQFAPSGTTWLFGAVNGMVLFIFNLSTVNASRTGPYTLQSLLTYSGCVLVPLVFSTLYWQDQIFWYQYVGIVIMLIAFAIINLQNTTFIIKKKSYFLWIALLFLSNGFYGVIMDAQQRVMQQAQRNEMIVITFFVSSLISLVYLLATQKNKSLHAFSMRKKVWLYILLSSISAAAGVYLMMVLLGNMTSSIFYTIENGAVLALTILLGHFVLREQLTKRMVLGILLSIISLVLLAM